MTGIHAIYSGLAKAPSTMRQKLVSLTPVALRQRVVVGACAQTANRSTSLQQSNREYHTLSPRKSIPVAGLALKVSGRAIVSRCMRINPWVLWFKWVLLTESIGFWTGSIGVRLIIGGAPVNIRS